MQENDYGSYKCVAKNPRGETDGGIRLYCKFHFLCCLFVAFFSFNLYMFPYENNFHCKFAFIALYFVGYSIK